jgi:hypothetical protein
MALVLPCPYHRLAVSASRELGNPRLTISTHEMNNDLGIGLRAVLNPPPCWVAAVVQPGSISR